MNLESCEEPNKLKNLDVASQLKNLSLITIQQLLVQSNKQEKKDELEQKKIKSQISKNRAVASKLRADARSKNFKTKRDKALFNAQQNINDKFEQSQNKRVDGNNTNLTNRNINQLVQEDYYNTMNIKNLSKLSDREVMDLYDEAFNPNKMTMSLRYSIDRRNFSDEEKQKINDEILSRKAKQLGLTLEEYKKLKEEVDNIDDKYDDLTLEEYRKLKEEDNDKGGKQ